VLPRCVGTIHEFGTLALGGGQTAPLRAVSGDQSAAVFAFGPPEPTTGYVNVGTGAFLQRVLPDGSVPTPHGLLKSVLFAHTNDTTGALYCHEGTVNGGFAALDWLGRRLGLDVRSALAALASTLADGNLPVLFLNGVGGLGAPYWLPDFPVEFVAAEPDASSVALDSATDLQQVGAVVESIAFLIAVNVRAMQRTAPLRRLLLTGGLASCDYLCTVLAAVTRLKVDRPELLEATARGIAYLAAGQPQDWQAVPIASSFAPDIAHGSVQRFGHWLAAMGTRGAR
jgi:glycerol kinase